APGMRSPRNRPYSTGTTGSWLQCITSVGAATVDSMGDTSIWELRSNDLATHLRSAGAALVAGEHPLGRRGIRGVRQEHPVRSPRAPIALEVIEILTHRLGRHGLGSRERPVQDKRTHALRMRRREVDHHGTALGDPVEDRLPGPDRVEDSPDVLGPVLDAPEAEGAVREPGAALVERDHPAR